jgi:hypothetical protein
MTTQSRVIIVMALTVIMSCAMGVRATNDADDRAERKAARDAAHALIPRATSTKQSTCDGVTVYVTYAAHLSPSPNVVDFVSAVAKNTIDTFRTCCSRTCHASTSCSAAEHAHSSLCTLVARASFSIAQRGVCGCQKYVWHIAIFRTCHATAHTAAHPHSTPTTSSDTACIAQRRVCGCQKHL